MASVKSSTPVPDAGAAAGSTRVFIKQDLRASKSSGHLSEGGCSISRRSRVRRKNSRNSQRDDDSSSDLLSTSGDISSGQLFVKIPPADATSGASPKSLGTLETGVPPRPPRSPRRLQSAGDPGSLDVALDQHWTPRQRTRSIDPSTTRPEIDDSRGRETCSENGQFRRGQRPRVLSLPRHAFRNNSLSDSSEQPSPLTPNAFNDIPPIPVFAQNRRYRHQPRGSGFTQQSTTSSSLYPKSTSTESSYHSPPSLPAQDMDDRHIIAINPADDSHLIELQEMDADDVSYRLRLLVQNNYYLPPAHSKPFTSDTLPEIPKKSPIKSSSPTFFDLFKVGKKKSTVVEQKTGAIPSAPMLRTTSDSSTMSGLLRPHQLSVPTQRPHIAIASPPGRQDANKGRVVVVRERMDDLEGAAKQVEQELKVREAERRRLASETSHSEVVQDDFVDPTDSVDLPAVPSNEFFGPQAALLHGMGIDSSVGAALLADQLPPSSPGIWSSDSEDAAWRKAILHAAVGHSLNNSPAVTPARSRSGSNPFKALDLATSPLLSPTSPSLRVPSITSPATSLPPSRLLQRNNPEQSTRTDPAANNKQRIIGERILNNIMDEGEPQSIPQPQPDIIFSGVESESKLHNQKEKVQGLRITTRESFEIARAYSPTVPTTPLLPPPRRPNPTPAHSNGSHSDNVQNQEGDDPLEGIAEQLHVGRDATLRLSDTYESHIGLSGAFGELTPPPGSKHSSQPDPAPLSSVNHAPGRLFIVSESITTESQYSEDEGISAFHTPREHTLASTFTASRPSLSSQPAPRVSCESSQASPIMSTFREAFDRSPFADSVADHSVVNTLGSNSRTSSRISDRDDPRYVISPPPRVSSSLAYTALHPPPVRMNSQLGPFGQESEEDEPGTPTELHVPRLSVQGVRPGIESNSYLTSPISFFDAVEMQGHQDEEDGSSESENEDMDDTESEDQQDDMSVVSSRVDEYQSDCAGMAVIDPRTGSLHSVVHDSRQVPSLLMQQRNSSLPQLGSRQSPVESNGSQGGGSVDHNKAISNVPQSSLRTALFFKKQGKLPEQLPNPPRISESTVDRLKAEATKDKLVGGKRPHTTGSNPEKSSRTDGVNVQAWQEEQNQLDPATRRLDGMLIEHMEREKEVLKRITTTLSKSSG